MMPGCGWITGRGWSEPGWLGLGGCWLMSCSRMGQVVLGKRPGDGKGQARRRLPVPGGGRDSGAVPPARAGLRGQAVDPARRRADNAIMRLSDFDFDLPERLIATRPARPR